jgi:hypothetical protein
MPRTRPRVSGDCNTTIYSALANLAAVAGLRRSPSSNPTARTSTGRRDRREDPPPAHRVDHHLRSPGMLNPRELPTCRTCPATNAPAPGRDTAAGTPHPVVTTTTFSERTSRSPGHKPLDHAHHRCGRHGVSDSVTRCFAAYEAPAGFPWNLFRASYGRNDGGSRPSGGFGDFTGQPATWLPVR